MMIDTNLGKNSKSRCPLWVKSRHVQRRRSCPLYPRKRTCRGATTMSAKGQKRTLRQVLLSAFFTYAARSTRVVISLRSAPKSMGLVKSASAPPSNALRLVSASP